MVTDVLSVLTDPNAITKIAKIFAQELSKGGNSSSFSSMNPTGEGRAGGRGTEEKQMVEIIKTKRLEHKLLNQVTKNLKHLNKELDEGEKRLGKASRHTERFSKIFGDIWGNALEEVEKSSRSEAKMIRQLNEVMDENIESIEDVMEVRARQQKLEKEILNTKTVTNRSTVEKYNKLSKALGNATHGLEDSLQATLDNTKRGIRAFFSIEAALMNLGRAISQLTADYRAQIKFGSQMNAWQNQWTAVGQGLDPGAFTEMMASARQASLTFDSVGAYSEQIKTAQRAYYNQIGDLTAASQFAHDSFMMLGRSGIRPTEGSIDALGQSFRVLNKLTGMTSDQFTTMMDQTLQDTDIQHRLMVAKKGERQSIVDGIARQLEMNVAMGMTAEQAQRAAVAMGKIAGGGAKERFKRAAQIQMAAGAMGIEGGAELGDLTRKGKQRFSGNDQERFDLLTKRFTDRATQMTAGTIPEELMRDAILDKTGLASFFGTDSPLNTALTDGFRVEKGLLEEIRDALTSALSGWQSALMIWDHIRNFFVNGALGNILVSILQAGGAMLIGGMLAKLGIMGTIGAVTGALGTFATAAGALAAPILAAAGAIWGAYELYQSLADTDLGRGTSDVIGAVVDNTLATFGNDEAQYRLEQLELAKQNDPEYQKELLEKQLLQAEKQTALQELQVKYNAQQITATEFSARMQRISTMGTTPGLAND